MEKVWQIIDGYDALWHDEFYVMLGLAAITLALLMGAVWWSSWPGFALAVGIIAGVSVLAYIEGKP